MRLLLASLAVALAACSPVAQHADNSLAAHQDKRATDSAVSAALNGGGPADYPRAIAAIEQSGRPQGVIDLQVGDMILSAYRDGPPAILPRQSVGEGLGRLERAATGSGESKETAPQHLQLWFERGAGAALKPDPALAQCWQGVADGKGSAAACVEMRAKR